MCLTITKLSWKYKFFMSQLNLLLLHLHPHAQHYMYLQQTANEDYWCNFGFFRALSCLYFLLIAFLGRHFVGTFLGSDEFELKIFPKLLKNPPVHRKCFSITAWYWEKFLTNLAYATDGVCAWGTFSRVNCTFLVFEKPHFWKDLYKTCLSVTDEVYLNSVVYPNRTSHISSSNAS